MVEKILHFWFEEITPNQWYEKNKDIDNRIRAQFLSTHEQAARGETAGWRSTPQGRLAEIIVLDQFSRNMFRDHSQAFAFDALALELAQEVVRVGDDQKLSATQRQFIYLPYMHSEDPRIHEKALVLFNQPGLEENLEYEHHHKKIIDRFGRYPHRNQILGRVSTPEEIEFLKEKFSSF